MKIYEYILRMKDQAGDKLDRLASSFSTTSAKADRLQGSTDRVSNKLANVGNNATRATSAFSELGNQWSRSFSLGTMLTRVLGPLALGAALTFGTMKASSLAREMEQASISFEVFLGSAKKAGTMIGSITEMANVTPFTRTELMDSAKMMLNFGIAQDKIMPHLQMLGDISGGNASKMHLMTLAFSQMSAAGRLMGQDLLQMINAGFNPLQEISTKTGISMGKLKKLMEDGAISTNMVEAAFKSATSAGGRYFGMMDKQSQTFEGRLSTLKDKTEIWATSWGDSINTKLSPVLDSLIKSIDYIVDPVGKANREFEAQANFVNRLDKEAAPLILRYEELSGKAKLNKIEQQALADVTKKLSDILPEAASKWDALGNAISFNKDKLHLLVAESKEAMKILNADAIKETQFEFTRRTIEANDLLYDLQNKKLNAGERKETQERLKGVYDIIEGLNNQSRSLQGLNSQKIQLLDNVPQRFTKIGQPNWLNKIVGGAKPITDLFKFLDGAPGAKALDSNKSTGDPYADLKNKAGNLKDGIHGIAGGGKQAVNVTINLQSLVAEQNFNTTSVKESVSDIERMVTETLLRVLNSANYAAAQ